MIHIERLKKTEYRVKLYATQQNGKLEWVDTEHVFGKYEGLTGLYMNPSLIPDIELQATAFELETRYYFSEVLG